jgi:7-cyano-7-deazaguanine reductase
MSNSTSRVFNGGNRPQQPTSQIAQQSMNDFASKSLGSSASYAVYTDKFDASLLNPMPRILARQDHGITGSEFVGGDVWHCHEATFLLDNGYPIAGTLKYTYPANSEFMVESKSAKLYLNSFDMCKMGSTPASAIANYEQQVANDLAAVLKTNVDVVFFPSGSDKYGKLFSEDEYRDLYWELLDIAKDIEVTDYSSNANHLKFVKIHPEDNECVSSKYSTNALRSRCRHTKQKDTGAAYIHIVSKNGMMVDPASLFKQIVSLREVNEFHEFCAEKLFKSIMEHPEVEDCCVTLLYSRRGSLDINPVRASKPELLPVNLINASIYTIKAMGQ